RPMPDAANPYSALATPNTQNAGDRRAEASVESTAVVSGRSTKPTSSSSLVLGSGRTRSHATGARPNTRAPPTDAQATRQPCARTSAPTAGNAIMNPTLMTSAYTPIAHVS